jgi:hypothetical protein
MGLIKLAFVSTVTISHVTLLSILTLKLARFTICTRVSSPNLLLLRFPDCILANLSSVTRHNQLLCGMLIVTD